MAELDRLDIVIICFPHALMLMAFLISMVLLHTRPSSVTILRPGINGWAVPLTFVQYAMSCLAQLGCRSYPSLPFSHHQRMLSTYSYAYTLVATYVFQRLELARGGEVVLPLSLPLGF
jgi:hypothetical protein